MTYDFTDRMHTLLRTIVGRTPELNHVDPDRLMTIITLQRSRWREGLFAQLIPLRFRDGAEVMEHKGILYRAPRVVRDGNDILYIVSFCLPRFLNRTFEEKINTVFHELYHISERFDGDLRRPGKRRLHTKAFYAAVEQLAARFLAEHDPAETAFLVPDVRRIKRKYGSIRGERFRIPQPVRVGTAPAAAKTEPSTMRLDKSPAGGQGLYLTGGGEWQP